MGRRPPRRIERMKYCSACGTSVVRSVPEGDDGERAVCPSFEAVHYENPRNVVGCIAEFEGRLLLCRRAIEPSVGAWTLPAGFLELDESLWAGAARETWEEARARVEPTAPHAVLDLLHIGQVYTLFRANLPRPEFEAGPESLEVALFDRDAIPFGELAFPVVEVALRLYLDDLDSGGHHFHLGQLRWSGEGSRFDAANYDLEGHLRVPLQGGVAEGPGSELLRRFK
jgi:ADP-ribose pyrophosphatase YjhB (NUDIX family)